VNEKIVNERYKKKKRKGKIPSGLKITIVLAQHPRFTEKGVSVFETVHFWGCGLLLMP
jgi:hypothetical protein